MTIVGWQTPIVVVSGRCSRKRCVIQWVHFKRTLLQLFCNVNANTKDPLEAHACICNQSRCDDDDVWGWFFWIFITVDKWIVRAAFYMQPKAESLKTAIQDLNYKQKIIMSHCTALLMKAYTRIVSQTSRKKKPKSFSSSVSGARESDLLRRYVAEKMASIYGKVTLCHQGLVLM